MSTNPPDDPRLSAQQEAAIRRALAAAGGTDPLPEELGARLDGVIAELAAGRRTTQAPRRAARQTRTTRSDGTPIAPGDTNAAGQVVVPLDAAARRRRSRARVLLLAAAAVVVASVSAGFLGNGRDSDALTAADQISAENPTRVTDGAMAGDSASAAPPAGEAFEHDHELGDELSGGHELRRTRSSTPLRTVDPTSLRADLVALQHENLPDPRTADYSGATLWAPAGFRCEPAHFGRGNFIGVRYADHSAVVAFRAPVGSTQVAEVLACGTGDILRSTTIPVS